MERNRVSTALAMLIWTFSMSVVSADQDNVVAEGINVVFILADDLGWGELGCSHAIAVWRTNETLRFVNTNSGVGVVDLAKDPYAAGSLARSTTLRNRG